MKPWIRNARDLLILLGLTLLPVVLTGCAAAYGHQRYSAMSLSRSVAGSAAGAYLESGVSSREWTVPPQSLSSLDEELWVIQKPTTAWSLAADVYMPKPGSGALVTKTSQDGQVVPLPLKHTDVKASIAGYIATVDVTQQFHNPYDGKILNFSVSSGLFFRGVKRSQLQEEKVQQDPVAQADQAPTGWAPPGRVASDLPWALSISLSHSGSVTRLPTGGYSRWRNSGTTANTSFGINPTNHWRVDYSAQLDVEHRKLTSWNYSVKRDLHCWEAQFTRSNSGGITEYYFKINVKNLPEVYYEQGSRGLRGFGGIQNGY